MEEKKLTKEELLEQIRAKFAAAEAAKAEEYRTSPQNYEMFW